MEFEKYQDEASLTAQYPKIKVHIPHVEGELVHNTRWIYPLLGLMGEAGELTEKLKKILRNQNGIVRNEDKEEIGKEIGDILWYLAEISTCLELDLGVLAEQNLKKLQSRVDRDVIKSKGDNR